MTFLSASYWEQRYVDGGSSGSGSTGRSARFKADFLNTFVKEHGVATVVEFGCGDGQQLALADYPWYTGYDVSRQAIRLCWQRYREDVSKEFFLLPRHHVQRKDLALSLDVVYHLVEDDVYQQHLQDVFGASTRWAIFYTSDLSWASNDHTADHVRHRPVITDINSQFPDWSLIENTPGMDGCHFLVYERTTS